MRKLYTDDDQCRASGCASVNEQDINRSAFQKDYARLLHAPAFRRLQGKTQLFPGSDSDFFRNRLTHSLEVSQIASGIADVLNHREELNINTNLVQFAAISHDLGHPPFGHNGEYALEELMREHGGFEGNAQTLRILTSVEAKMIKTDSGLIDTYGLDLTYRTLASILKYDRVIPVKKEEGEKLAKGYYHTEQGIVDGIKHHVAPGYMGEFKTIECGIMDIADDIAYSTYDLEDSLHAGIITPLSLLTTLFDSTEVRRKVNEKTNKALRENGYAELASTELETILAEKLVAPPSEDEPTVTNNLIFDNAIKAVSIKIFDQNLATNAIARTMFTSERVGQLIQQVEYIPNKEYPALSKVRLSRDALLEVEIYKHLNYETVIRSPQLAVVQHRGKDIVKKIFKAIYRSDGELLSAPWKKKWFDSTTDTERHRVICDFVAGMTDRYAVEVYDALFGEGKSIYGPM